MHPGSLYRDRLIETLMMEETENSHKQIPSRGSGKQEPVIISDCFFPCVLQLQWVAWCKENKWASGCFSVQQSQILEQWDIHEITAHNWNTGANKTQTKQSIRLWRAKNCLGSFQQYTECNILSTSMLFRAFLQIFGEKEGRWNGGRTMGLWLCYGVRAPLPASPL